jgi:acyl CoA:acetate/3-ketoacid CoA transferase beta subunit
VQIPEGVSSPVDEQAAAYIIEEMRDECCIQLGIGGMPNAVGKMIAANLQ